MSWERAMKRAGVWGHLRQNPLEMHQDRSCIKPVPIGPMLLLAGADPAVQGAGRFSPLLAEKPSNRPGLLTVGCAPPPWMIMPA